MAGTIDFLSNPTGGGGYLYPITLTSAVYDLEGTLLSDILSTMNSTISKKADSSHNHDSVYTKLSHTHAISDITNLQSTLDSKAASSHTHAISDITNLQSTLDGKASSSHTHAYLPLSGGTMKGNIVIDPDIEGTDTVTLDTVDQNTNIKFSNNDNSQWGALIWNQFDNYQKPASLTFLGNQGGEYFIAPNIKATSTIYEGGTALSSKYLSLSGGTLTGDLFLKPRINFRMECTGNGDEWSFDFYRNGHSGCYWHVWDSKLNSLLQVNADNGRVTARYSFDTSSYYCVGNSGKIVANQSGSPNGALMWAW